MYDPHYNVNLPQFEGSLDLLLHLINSNKIDIYDIPIALITKQYLEYLDIMKDHDLNIASDFIVMASTLIYIKSCMLLPPDEAEEDNQQIDDPRMPLVERLLEYQAYKEASMMLKEMELRMQEVFSRPDIKDIYDLTDDGLFLPEAGIFDLMEAVRKIFKNISSEPSVITRETLTIKDRIALILQKIDRESAVNFQDFFSGQESRIGIIITFLALLEILKMGIAKAYQETEFGNLWIVKAASANEMNDY